MTSKFNAALIAAAAIFCLPASAFATGNLGCTIEDKNLDLDFEAIYSYSDIGGLFQLRGTLDAKSPKVYKSLRKFEIKDDDLRQQWFRGEDLKLMLYRETVADGEPHASVKLIIEAKRPSEDDMGYDGTYALTIEPAVTGSESQSVTVKGKVSCGAG
jgi:hypothetical protein